jgi:alkylhydroperoxidase/carboxymuconolactone decarboxylase family protein YurZ
MVVMSFPSQRIAMLCVHCAQRFSPAHHAHVPRRPAASLDRMIDEVTAAYGERTGTREEYDRLARNVPAIVEGYLTMRRGMNAEDAALTPAVRELVMLSALIAMKKANPPPLSHVRMALDHGATVKQIAEVVGLCLMLGGMTTYRETGGHVLAEAERLAALRKTGAVRSGSGGRASRTRGLSGGSRSARRARPARTRP